MHYYTAINPMTEIYFSSSNGIRNSWALVSSTSTKLTLKQRPLKQALPYFRTCFNTNVAYTLNTNLHIGIIEDSNVC